MNQSIKKINDASLQISLKEILKESEIRFACFVDYMGKVRFSEIREGISLLTDESLRQKMFLEVALRVKTRQEFDDEIGPVLYAASRRTKVVMMTFPIMDTILFVSMDPDVDIEKMAKRIIQICVKSNLPATEPVINNR